MQKKRALAFLFIISFLILSIILVSAFSFKEFFNKITGHVISDSDLIAHYKFENNPNNEKLSGVATSGNPTYTAGKSGQAISLDGIDDYVSQNTLASTSISPVKGTFALWANFDSSTLSDGKAHVLVGAGNSNSDTNYISLRKVIEGNKLIMRYRIQGVVYDAGVSATPLGWNHIVGVWNENTLSLYINGALNGQIAVPQSSIDLFNQFRIGTREFQTPLFYFKGQIDDVKVFNRDLTAQEITDLYNSYSALPPQPVCGNNQIEVGEVCDSNSQDCTINGYSGTKTCNAQCSDWNACTPTQFCGDNIINGLEVCDGNTQPCITNGYGGTQTCNSQCSGFSTTCTATQRCGDGIRNGPEICDDGDTTSTASDSCYRDCRYSDSDGGLNYVFQGACTDGITTLTDTCGDSNYVKEAYFSSGGGCGYVNAICANTLGNNYVCQTGACKNPSSSTVCGNGVLEGTEQCDDGSSDPTDSYYNCGTGCKSADDDGSCVIDYSRNVLCKNNICGDGYKNSATEQCDDTNTNNGDGCSSTCISESYTCTDSDGGRNTNIQGTTTDSSPKTRTDTCTVDGLFEYYCSSAKLVTVEYYFTPTGQVCRNGAFVSPTCGDGLLEGTEQCDDSNTANGDGCSSSCANEDVRTCSDTDVTETYTDGKNYFTKGTVSTSLNSVPSAPQIDTCSNGNLIEYFCTPEKTALAETYTCPSGYVCSDGACVTQAVPNCSPSFYCTISPAECPSNGLQTKTCEDTSDCGAPSYNETTQCSPGQCTGCKWGSQCIAQGIRMKYASYYDIYCNSNKYFYYQKYDGSSCQNNFECLSNQCSDGVCVALVEEIRAQTNLLVRIICKLNNLFDDTAYQQCILTYSSQGTPEATESNNPSDYIGPIDIETLQAPETQ